MNEELAKALVAWEEHPDENHFVEVREKEVYETSRWNIFYSSIWKDIRDGRYWEISWDEGATEYQESSDEVYFHEVFPVEKTITVYVTKKEAA